MIPPLDRLVRKLETSNLFLRTFAAVACVRGVLAYFCIEVASVIHRKGLARAGS